ncbi:MAG: aminoglycoside 6-adenylyltransferase [Caldilineaceae bacterium]
MQDELLENEVIQQLVQWAASQAAVRAMLLTSTRAVPNAPVDMLSDYDVILVTADIRPFHADRSWLQAFGEVLVAYWDPIHSDPDYGCDRFGNVIQFTDGLKIDFTLWPVALLQQIAAASTLLAELDAGYRILLDKDGLTTGMATPTYRAYLPTLPDAATFQRIVEEFFSDVPYVAKCLWRDELLPAKWCLDYDMKHVYLRQMLEWKIALDYGGRVKPGALGKGLKKHLPNTLWVQLEGAYAGAGVAENWDALWRTIHLYHEVALEVAKRLGYNYPHELEQCVVTYAQRIRDMTP